MFLGRLFHLSSFVVEIWNFGKFVFISVWIAFDLNGVNDTCNSKCSGWIYYMILPEPIIPLYGPHRGIMYIKIGKAPCWGIIVKKGVTSQDSSQHPILWCVFEFDTHWKWKCTKLINFLRTWVKGQDYSYPFEIKMPPKFYLMGLANHSINKRMIWVIFTLVCLVAEMGDICSESNIKNFHNWTFCLVNHNACPTPTGFLPDTCMQCYSVQC